MKKALIIGSTGQDGRLLAEQLRQDNVIVVGLGRESIDGSESFGFSHFKIGNSAEVAAAIAILQPDEIYYLAAFHHSSEERVSSDTTELWQRSFSTHVTGLINVLEAMKKRSPHTRVFYAASSHVFGDPAIEPQDEQTPFNPKNIYGITKAAGVQCCRFYRSEHSLFASAGILFNHESSLRAEKFVSQKIVRAAHRIKAGLQSELILGDLSAQIDWGFAPDFVRAMRLILAADAADDFVVATGEMHSVGEFVEIAFSALGIDWRKHVTEKAGVLTRRKSILRGNPNKLKRITGWKPSVTFEQMVQQLVEQSDVA